MAEHKIENKAFRAFRALLGLTAVGLLASLLACGVPGHQVGATFTPEQRCTTGGGTWDAGSERLGAHCAKGSLSQCEATGGHWQRVCMLGTLACVKPYADAGKTCRSGQDCLGHRCLMDSDAPPQVVPQTGHCIGNDNPCYFGINLENGRPVPTAVAD